MRSFFKFFPAIFWLALFGCTTNVQLPFLSPSPTAVNQMSYDAPVTFTIKTGATLPGTTIAYGGKNTSTGAANILIGGLVAPKQTADTVDWQGAPVPNTAVKLNLRVAKFDEQSITLVGTAHVDILNIQVTPGGTPGTQVLEFSSPVTFSLNKDAIIPGSNLVYAGSTPNGAQFLGLDGYPYRKQLDSLQYIGRLGQKVFLKLDLRVINFNESSVVVGGTANIRLEQ